MQNFYSKLKSIFVQTGRDSGPNFKLNSDSSVTIERSEINNIDFNANSSGGIKPVGVLNSMKPGYESVIKSMNYKQERYSSVTSLSSSFNILQLQCRSQKDDRDKRLFIELPERETNNSIMLYNSLMGYDESDGQGNIDLQRTYVGVPLYQVSNYLGSRLLSALYLLNPNNPNAAGYFCFDVKPIILELIQKFAPEDEVLENYKYCIVDEEGKPFLRSKIGYLLNRKDSYFTALENFIVNDINDLRNMMDIICMSAKEGAEMRFEMPQLLKLKKRVEDAIMFIMYVIE